MSNGNFCLIRWCTSKPFHFSGQIHTHTQFPIEIFNFNSTLSVSSKLSKNKISSWKHYPQIDWIQLFVSENSNENLFMQFKCNEIAVIVYCFEIQRKHFV